MRKGLILLGLTMCAGLSGCWASDFFLGHKETRKEVFDKADINKDGKVDANELAQSGLDTNHDGILTTDELDAGKKDTDAKGSGIINAILATLAALSVPGAAAAKMAWDYRAHARALIAGIEDVKAECMTRGAGTGSPLSADNWPEIVAKLTAAAKEHTNPVKLDAFVQKVTGQLAA